MEMNPIVTEWEGLGSTKQILANSMPFKAVGCRVPASLANGTLNGRSIVKKGTPVICNLQDRSVAVTAATADDATGVLVHDVPAFETGQTYNGTLLIDGGIILEHIDTDIQALITATPLIESTSSIKYIGKWK